MGRSTNSKGKGKGAKEESQVIKRVDLHKLLGKWILRSYPDDRDDAVALHVIYYRVKGFCCGPTERPCKT